MHEINRFCSSIPAGESTVYDLPQNFTWDRTATHEQRTGAQTPKKLYGLKDSGRTWHQHFIECLQKLGYRSTQSDPCIYVKNENIIVLYVDDRVIVSQTKHESEQVFRELSEVGFQMTDEGFLVEYPEL